MDHPVKLTEEQQYYKYPNRFLHSVQVQGACSADILARDKDACMFFKKGWYDKTKALLEGNGVVTEDLRQR